MQNIDTMIDDITALPAAQFNQPMTELENLIQASQQVLSASDLGQVSKSVSAHSAGADYYADLNIDNNDIELATIRGFVTPHELFVGMKIRFVPSASNDNTSVTVKLGSLPVTPVNFGKLADAGTPSVKVGTIKAGLMMNAEYSVTDNGLTNYWRLVGSPLTLLESGDAFVDQDSSISIGSVSPDKYALLEGGNLTLRGSGAGGKLVGVKNTGLYFPDGFNDGVGFKFINAKPASFPVDLTGGVVTSGIFDAALSLVATGIPAGANIYGATVSAEEGSNMVSMDGSLRTEDDGSGTKKVVLFSASNTVLIPANLTNEWLTIWYDTID
jgi:hypothetical protein